MIFFWFIEFWWLCIFEDEFDLSFIILLICKVLRVNCFKFNLRSWFWFFDIFVKLVDEFNKFIDSVFVFDIILDDVLVRLVKIIVFKYIFVLMFYLVKIFFLK